MASKTETKTNGQTRTSGRKLWDWDRAQVGALAGAAVAGVALGFAANIGRKFLVQSSTASAGDWFDALKAEHALVLALFDRLDETGIDEAGGRAVLLGKLKLALSKHAAEEEMVIYPALRETGQTDEADELNSDHGYVKTYLYELETMSADDPQWIVRLRDFRVMLEEHIREEESSVFPALRAQLGEEQNGKLTTLMNKEGFAHA